jgi:hypothetical protein
MTSYFSFKRFRRTSSQLKPKSNSINNEIEIGVHFSSKIATVSKTSMRNPNYGDDLTAINAENDDTTGDDVAILPDVESNDQTTSKLIRCFIYMNQRINQCLDSNKIKVFMVFILFTLNLINYMDRFTVAGKYLTFLLLIYLLIKDETR